MDDLSLYCHFMRLIKFRLDTVNRLLSGEATNILPGVLLAEFCTLQQRMVCELIALACLSLHRDVPKARNADLAKLWQADAIIGALDKLHPKFYPRPYKPQGISRVPVESGYLTKLELKQLWRLCGERLHQGTVTKPIALQPAIDITKDLIDAHNKITLLLNTHWIQMVEPDWIVTVNMASKDHGGEVVGDMVFKTDIGDLGPPTT